MAHSRYGEGSEDEHRPARADAGVAPMADRSFPNPSTPTDAGAGSEPSQIAPDPGQCLGMFVPCPVPSRGARILAAFGPSDKAADPGGAFGGIEPSDKGRRPGGRLWRILNPPRRLHLAASRSPIKCPASRAIPRYDQFCSRNISYRVNLVPSVFFGKGCMTEFPPRLSSAVAGKGVRRFGRPSRPARPSAGGRLMGQSGYR